MFYFTSEERAKCLLLLGSDVIMTGFDQEFCGFCSENLIFERFFTQGGPGLVLFPAFHLTKPPL